MQQKFVIYAHFAGDGNTEALRDWLIRRQVPELVYIAFPFADCADPAVRVCRYEHGRLVEERRSRLRFKRPFVLSYLKDFMYGLWLGLRYGRNADFFCGGDNLLTLCGILLRRVCRIGTVCYYMIDYTPRRYATPLLDRLYWWLDRQAAERAGVVWAPADETIQGRFDAGRLDPARVRWEKVPYGTVTVPVPGTEQVKVRRLMYMGGLHASKGAHRLIEIFQAVRVRCGDGEPWRMIIIGRGPLEADIRRQIAEGGLEGVVELRGYMEDYETLLMELARGGIALAPYDPEDVNSFSRYADAGKLKVYAGCGLPVVATEVPPFVRELIQAGAGLAAAYDPHDFADQIDTVQRHYPAFRSAALALGREYDWDTIFSRALNGGEG